MALYIFIGLFVIAAATWIFTTDTVARRTPFVWRGFDNGIDLDFRHGNGWFEVGVTKQGRSLPEAAITLHTGFPLFLRFPEGGGELSSGRVQEGKKWVGWSESGVPIAGGGHRTRLSFRAGVPPGDHDITLRIYDDVLGSPVTITKTLVVASRSVDPEDARKRLNSLLNRLHGNQRILLDSLKTGEWCPPDVPDAFHTIGTGQTYRPYASTETIDAVTEAFSEANRVAESFENGMELADAQVERAVVSTLYAEIRVESDLEAKWAA
jgi:hypothetical protein